MMRIMVFLAALVFVLPGKAAAEDKVTFCHATGSESNPYVLITTAPQAVKSGHIDHQHGEDIIPQFTIESGPHAGTYGPQGDQSILANGCVVPSPEPTEEPTDEPTVPPTQPPNPPEAPAPTPPGAEVEEADAGPGGSQAAEEVAPGRRPSAEGEVAPVALAETGVPGLGWWVLLFLVLFAIGITLVRFSRR